MRSKSVVNSPKGTTPDVKNAQRLNTSEVLDRAAKRTTAAAARAAKKTLVRCDSDADVNTPDVQNKIITVILSLLAEYLRSDAVELFIRRNEKPEKITPFGMGKVVGVKVDGDTVGLDIEWNEPYKSLRINSNGVDNRRGLTNTSAHETVKRKKPIPQAEKTLSEDQVRRRREEVRLIECLRQLEKSLCR